MTKALVFDGENEISVIPSDITLDAAHKYLLPTMIFRDSLKSAIKAANGSTINDILNTKYTQTTHGFGYVYGKLIDEYGEDKTLTMISEISLLINLEEQEFNAKN